MKTWFITGVSRGLGLAIAKAVLADGGRVIGTVRGDPPERLFKESRFQALTMEMHDPEAVESTVHEAFALAGRIDVIVNNAGYGLLGAVEQSTDEELSALFSVDVFAPIRITRVVLPYLRQQGSGHVIFITSIAGRAPSVGAALYSAAKHAVEGFASSLAIELAPLGIKVTAVAPGQFRTDFLNTMSIKKSRIADAAYSDTVGRTMVTLDTVNRNQLGDPDKAAKVIVEMVADSNPPVHLLLGSDALMRARQKLDHVVDELDIWIDRTRSTDFA